MTADDLRYTLREAADLTDKSVDALRRWVKSGKLPGAGKDPGDPTCTIYIPASVLIAAGLLAAEQLADGEPEEVLARRRAERERGRRRGRTGASSGSRRLPTGGSSQMRRRMIKMVPDPGGLLSHLPPATCKQLGSPSAPTPLCGTAARLSEQERERVRQAARALRPPAADELVDRSGGCRPWTPAVGAPTSTRRSISGCPGLVAPPPGARCWRSARSCACWRRLTDCATRGWINSAPSSSPRPTTIPATGH
jgi:hypothetical protein